MGIDGIGKPGPGRPPDGVSGGAGSSAVTGARGEPFKVEAGASAGVQGSDDLARLHRGELSLDAYLDARSAEAVRHLEGKLSAEQLEFVRQTLREQLATDPVLVELVRRATGGVPSEPA
jgi:hypothetical protein